MEMLKAIQSQYVRRAGIIASSATHLLFFAQVRFCRHRFSPTGDFVLRIQRGQGRGREVGTGSLYISGRCHPPLVRGGSILLVILTGC
jgi:hypothetical protein